MTPQEAAGLKAAQRVADEVTTAYEVKRTRIVPNPYGSGFMGRFWFIRTKQQLLADDAYQVELARALARPTLGSWTWEHPPSQEQAMSRHKMLAVNRRAVEILVGSFGLPEAEAVTQLTQLLVKQPTNFQAFEESVRRTGRF
jgi:hypothetical protein